MSTAPESETNDAPQMWHPISAADRRVVGVLVEKAKTTPDQYPLSLNALRNGCNQKSNRDPMMQLDFDEIEDSLYRLRRVGAVTEVHDSGRVKKFRHRLYEWLGVERAELAVMAELLLRGAQTLGELRARAARMEPLADLHALRPLLATLLAKDLVVYLTPEGRGRVVTHALYEAKELESLRPQYGTEAANEAHREPMPRSLSDTELPPRTLDPPAVTGVDASLRAEVEALRQEVGELRAQLAGLCDQVQRLTSC